MDDAKMSGPDALDRIRTADTISMSPELFEKLYLSPPNKVKGELRATFGNPTPAGLACFLLVLTPLSMVLLGWKGTQDPPGNLGFANVGSYLALGGLGLILSSIGEFILGNHFPMVVFLTYGGFLLSLGITVWPSSGAISSYSSDPVTTPAAGLKNPEFYTTLAFFLLTMGLLSLIFMIIALRTNVVFFLIFTLLVPTFCLLAASFWQVFSAPSVASSCQIAAGALAFVVSLLGWYIFTSIMLALVDWPFQLPIGDLSRFMKGASQKVAPV